MTAHRSPPESQASFPSLRLGGEWQLDNAYLDSASYGLPPRAAYEALQSVLAGWRGGRESAVPWNDATERSRQLFGELVGARVDRIATGSAVSPFVGLIAAALPKSRVLASDIEFSSLLWPWLAWDCDVRTVPSTHLAESIDGTTDVVLVSAVSSVTGEVADLDESSVCPLARRIRDRRRDPWRRLAPTGRRTLRCDDLRRVQVAAAPRGTAFLTIGDELLERMRPIFANWYAPDGFGGAYFGLPMPASPSARRLDLSPIWFSWIGTAPALEALLRQGVDEIYRHNVALANRFRAGLGLDASNSAIVTAELNATEAQFERAQVRLLVRDGRLRAAFHLYNNEADVDRALEAL